MSAPPPEIPQDAAYPAPPPAKDPPRARRGRRNADVWTWREPKYRIRAAILLSLNFLLFCGLCVFTHWLHTAQALDFSLESYFAPFRFWGEQTVNLHSFVLYPIDVRQTPAQGVVLGLLVASIVAIPIAVAILYRFPTSLPFAAAVLIFAHMPWMAITLVISCVLASVKPFRLSFRFGAALIALLPVLLYLFLATRNTQGDLLSLASPEELSVLMLPWVLAILAASIMFAVILTIARVVNYRPGAVLPVLAAMLAAPTILFHTQVGADELTYRVLEARYGPQSDLFRPVSDAEQQIKRLTLEYEPNRHELEQVWFGNVEPLRRRGLLYFVLDLLEAQAAADHACEQFYAAHVNSRHTAAVLYIHARALDTRLLDESLRARMQRELYFDFPSPRSERPWSILWNQHRDSTLSIVAAVRLAQLSLRSGDVPSALERLRPVVQEALYAMESPASEKDAAGLLTPAPSEETLQFEREPYLIEAHRLYELVRNNSHDPKYGNAPLQALASLDARRVDYKGQLLRLMQQYADSLLYDNLTVLYANAFTDTVDRALRLSRCLEELPEGDARLEAAFRLASLEIQALPDVSGATRERGLSRLGRLAHDHAHTIWGQLAQERLTQLGPVTATFSETD